MKTMSYQIENVNEETETKRKPNGNSRVEKYKKLEVLNSIFKLT